MGPVRQASVALGSSFTDEFLPVSLRLYLVFRSVLVFSASQVPFLYHLFSEDHGKKNEMT